MKTDKLLGVMLDCSRDAVYTVETLKNYFRLLKKMGYNSVQLYTEDTYETVITNLSREEFSMEEILDCQHFLDNFYENILNSTGVL